MAERATRIRGVIGKRVKLLRCLRTESSHYDAGKIMEVLDRARDGTYMLVRPNSQLEGPAAIFGHIHSVSRRDFEVLEPQ